MTASVNVLKKLVFGLESLQTDKDDHHTFYGSHTIKEHSSVVKHLKSNLDYGVENGVFVSNKKDSYRLSAAYHDKLKKLASKVASPMSAKRTKKAAPQAASLKKTNKKSGRKSVDKSPAKAQKGAVKKREAGADGKKKSKK